MIMLSLVAGHRVTVGVPAGPVNAITRPPAITCLLRSTRESGVLDRDAELSALAEAVRAAGHGDGSVVLVMGEAASASPA
jgi:hypothetical protein